MASEKKEEKITCPVDETLSVLRAALHDKEKPLTGKLRSTAARVARMVTEITLGRANVSSLDAVLTAASELDALGSPLGQAVAQSVAASRADWQGHLNGTCANGICFKPRSAPCQVGCPAHIDIPSMMALVGHGKFAESLDVIAKDTPFSETCGLVCPAPCEDACVQNTVTGKAVFIRPMKHVASHYAKTWPTYEKRKATGKKVAIVGCGPAGVTAAYYLAQMGHTVEIFDERDAPGGVMRYGIPNYRLPESKLYAEIDVVRNLGVEIHLGYHVSDAMEFKKKGYDATLLATGMQNSKRLGVPGDDLPFVSGGMDFLTKVRTGQNPRVGPHVVVIGGGNAAIDVAMTAFRQGAQKVQMWYRRNRKQMPANPHEVELALAEGVELVEFWAPTKIEEDGTIHFERSRYAPDAGKVDPVSIKADHIFAGIGQEADLSWLAGSKIETEWGNIKCDQVTLKTGEEGIFAGGDIAHGADTVVAAIGSGKRAAESIDAYLTGREADYESLEPVRREEVECLEVSAAQRVSADRAHIEELDPLKRRVSHDFMQKDWDPAVAAIEAGRCLRCDVCIGCGLCEMACAEMGHSALEMVETGGGRLVFKNFETIREKCVGCGACSSVCPTGAISVFDEGDFRITKITGTVVQKLKLQVCSQCGEKFSASTVQASVTRKGLGNQVTQSGIICPSCNRLNSANVLGAMKWSFLNEGNQAK